MTFREYKAVDNQFLQLAARGVSVLVSSGDDGAEWFSDVTITDQDFGKKLEIMGSSEVITTTSDKCLSIARSCSGLQFRLGGIGTLEGQCICATSPSKVVSNPLSLFRTWAVKNTGTATTSFPADSQWVTGVGGTSFEFRTTPVERQSAMVLFSGSGGGFSPRNTRQYYQETAVRDFFDVLGGPNTPPPDSFISTGRAVPDVAAIGEFVRFCSNGNCGATFEGTSVAAPIYGGFVSTLNEYLLANNQPRLGFLNPLLYKLKKVAGFEPPAVQTDITIGNGRLRRTGVPGIDDQGGILNYFGWNTETGWDPVTGLGTPNYEKFKAGIESFRRRRHHY